MGDQSCIDKAKADAKPVNIDSTRTVPAPSASAGGGAESGRVVSGGGGGGSNAVWANYDFVPGTKPIFFEDFRNDQIRDFPRRHEFSSGNVELVTFRNRPWLRFQTTALCRFQWRRFCHRALQSRWTSAAPAASAGSILSFKLRSDGNGGIRRREGDAVSGGGPVNVVYRGRIMIDGTYAKVYVDAVRAANVPNFNIERGTRIGFSCDGGMSIGGIRVAEGGWKPYQALAADGRAATLGIEGHTDNVGAAAANLDLSKQRAEAVKTYLVGTLHVDAIRLEATGFGATKPTQPNTTAEGCQTNRCVELVKLP